MIVPTFQRRGLVGGAVASVLAQTRRDFELIVVDDGSTDGTADALAPLGDALVYRWQTNAGVSAARNAGLALARGEIVAFLDSDNRWLPDHLATLTGVFDCHREAVLASTCPRFLAGGSQEPGSARLESREAPLPRRVRVGHVSCVGVRRSALATVGGFDEGMVAFEDMDLWARLALLGPFATVRRRTVIRQATAGSLRERARVSGDYLAAAERSAQSVAAAAEQVAEPATGSLRDEARGMWHLARAVRAVDAGDEAFARDELAAACRLARLSDLPEEAESPFRRHLRRADDPAERLRVRTFLARAWPDPGSDSARFMRVLAIAAAIEARRPAAAFPLLAGWPARGSVAAARRIGPVLWRRTLRSAQERRHRGTEPADGRHPSATAIRAQRAVIRAGAGPARLLWQPVCVGVALAVATYLRWGRMGSTTAYLRGSLASREALPGLSDVDFAILSTDGPRPGEAHAAIEARWQSLSRRWPRLRRTLVDRPKVYEASELAEVLAATTITHALDGTGSSRERRRSGYRSERPGLYGPLTLGTWRRIGGRERRPPVSPPGPGARRLLSWTELQYWWMQAMRASVARDPPWVSLMCAKLIVEPARIWAWLVHGERLVTRREVLRRAPVLLPEESDRLDLAARLLEGLHRLPEPPLREALDSLVRITERLSEHLAAEVAAAGATEVCLTGAQPGDELPLADWPAVVWPPALDEAIRVGAGDLADPEVLAAAAGASDAGGPYTALVGRNVIVLPSIERARLRAVHCAASDPVSFALLAGRDAARFPDVPGWSIRDRALRAVAEHRGWLTEHGRAGPSNGDAGRLLCAARAGLLFESVDAGAPELLLTTRATAERLGAAAGPELRRAVLDLPTYADIA